MPNAERLREFHTVATEQSISAAARTLNMERATLSRRMSNLEAELGVRLFLRSTASLILTEAGEALNARARQIITDTDEAWESVRRMDNTPRGRLRVSVIGNALDSLLIDYARDFPEVKLEVIDTVRQVNLYTENVDVATRFGAINDQNLIARKVNGGVDRFLVASVEYAEQHGLPVSLDELERHKNIVSIDSNGKSVSRWPLLNGEFVDITESFAANSMILQQQACLSGLGITFIPKPFVEELIEQGKLVRVLPEVVGDHANINIVFKDRKYIEPKVRQFVDRAVVELERIYGDR